MDTNTKEISQINNQIQIKTEPESKEVPDKSTLQAVLQILRKYNLKGTEELLKKEANVIDDPSAQGSDSEVSNVLSTYKSEGNPDLYEDAYMDLKKFVDSSLDAFKHELGMILYPVFVHMYLELVYNGHETQAVKLMERFGKDQEHYYQDDIYRLSMVTKREQMNGNEITDTFRSNEFIIRMSRDTLATLKRHLQERKQSIILNIIQEHLYFDMYEGVARTKRQIDSVAGSVVGEATRQDNKAKVYYGIPKEPDYQFAAVDDEEENDADADKPKKKKQKKDSIFSKKAKTDPNAPPLERLPLPELRDVDKMEKHRAMREASKRVSLGPDSLPSICCYTMLNAAQTVICADISDDASTLAIGFSNSLIKVWSLMPQKLRAMKSADQLQDIDHEAEDVWARIMDERNAETTKILNGHSGPIYNVSFSPDKSLLLSCSEDATGKVPCEVHNLANSSNNSFIVDVMAYQPLIANAISVIFIESDSLVLPNNLSGVAAHSVRLWSLLTWTCLVAYKGHVFPVWDVKFSPHGYYFATASNDKTARLWATDHHQPLRIFAGHFADVDKVMFHPNSNYVATGSSDRTVRLWDCITGNHVRVMTGHKAAVHALSFSAEGRFLASAGADNRVLLWDLAHGHLLAELSSHTAPVHCLAFSRDGTILVSGSLDCTVKLWDFTKLSDEVSIEDVNVTHNPEIRSNTDTYLLRTYATKNSPLISLQFSRRNVLLAVAMFDSTI